MMQPRVCWLVPVLFTVVAHLSAQAPGRRLSGKLLLRYHPPAGTQYHYVQEQEVHMRADTGSPLTLPEQRFRSLTYAIHEVRGPVPGGIAVTTRIDSAFVEAVLPTGETRREELAQLRGVIGGLLYDERMRLVRAEFVDATGQTSETTEALAENLKAFEVSSFPVRAVGVGDSWEETVAVPMELPGLNEPVRLRVRMTLHDARLDGGDTTVTIALGFRLPDEPLPVKEGETQFTMTFKGRWTGEIRYSLTRGATVTMDMGGSLRVEVMNPGVMNQPVALRMDQRLTHRIVAPAGGP